MKHFGVPILFAALLACATSAQASFSNGVIGLPSPADPLTFESATLGRNASVTTQFAGFGVTFSTAFWNPDISALYPHISGNRIGNFDSGRSQSGLFTMSFAGPLSQAAFAMVTAPGTSTFQALLNGVVVETETRETSTTDTANYFAFQGIVFDQITISVVSSDHALLLDNLQTVNAVTAVPEPETWALMMGGVVAVGAIGRRRRPATTA